MDVYKLEKSFSNWILATMSNMEQFYFQSNSPIQDLFGEATTGGVTGEVAGANYFGNIYGNSYGAVGNSNNSNGIANIATNPGVASASMSANSMGTSAGEFDISHYDVTFKDNINLHAKLGPQSLKNTKNSSNNNSTNFTIKTLISHKRG